MYPRGVPMYYYNLQATKCMGCYATVSSPQPINSTVSLDLSTAFDTVDHFTLFSTFDSLEWSTLHLIGQTERERDLDASHPDALWLRSTRLNTNKQDCMGAVSSNSSVWCAAGFSSGTTRTSFIYSPHFPWSFWILVFHTSPYRTSIAKVTSVHLSIASRLAHESTLCSWPTQFSVFRLTNKTSYAETSNSRGSGISIFFWMSKLLFRPSVKKRNHLARFRVILNSNKKRKTGLNMTSKSGMRFKMRETRCDLSIDSLNRHLSQSISAEIEMTEYNLNNYSIYSHVTSRWTQQQKRPSR